ncbi:DUF6481 family protein, partial [Falsiroseomonas sp.]|uniref:DUF6481 family protein n=1 Tax=Falsiroseomonas sp. TaxID=2870721 RepID=UPI00271A3847
GFQERVALANKAKQKALDKLKAKPPVDPAVLAERKAAQEAREAAQARKREEKIAAKAQAEAEAKALIEQAEAEAAVAAEAEIETEAEKKIKRDARYAARKKRR